ncbi:Uncharacterised protein [Campylobacter insulaenigrae]|uniref:hypothetical protein n=1 Tax=Campylobacter insulaenigrae TaxID=260714 RepID=UPI000F706656|nr:hypothetical protein [Campylobacter insulaenigrae]MCR6590506.1 hypothetical protein [Campylobacter insulaenigrae]MCR6592043.1 hypothetical protein [Campylobacter insulaenigrae]VEJ53318.1 Uncharacterised protein [Campylobacter insulaenigrae]
MVTIFAIFFVYRAPILDKNGDGCISRTIWENRMKIYKLLSHYKLHFTIAFLRNILFIFSLPIMIYAPLLLVPFDILFAIYTIIAFCQMVLFGNGVRSFLNFVFFGTIDKEVKEILKEDCGGNK